MLFLLLLGLIGLVGWAVLFPPRPFTDEEKKELDKEYPLQRWPKNMRNDPIWTEWLSRPTERGDGKVLKFKHKEK